MTWRLWPCSEDGRSANISASIALWWREWAYGTHRNTANYTRTRLVNRRNRWTNEAPLINRIYPGRARSFHVQAVKTLKGNNFYSVLVPTVVRVVDPRGPRSSTTLLTCDKCIGLWRRKSKDRDRVPCHTRINIRGGLDVWLVCVSDLQWVDYEYGDCVDCYCQPWIPTKQFGYHGWWWMCS